MDDEFKLCWKNFQDNIASGFQNLYDRGDLVDVTLACDGKLLQAHKIVLAICSPYFQEIFTTNPCQHPIIILKDVSFNIMCELLEFMYQGVVNVKHTELQSFMKIGQLLQIKGLATNSNSPPGSSASEKSTSQATNAAGGDEPNSSSSASSQNHSKADADQAEPKGSSRTPMTSPSGSRADAGLPMYMQSKRPAPAEFSSDSLSIYSRKQLRRSLTEQPGGESIDNADSGGGGMENALGTEEFFLPPIPHISMVEPRYDMGSLKREAENHHQAGASGSSGPSTAGGSLRNPFAPAFNLDYNNFYKAGNSSGASSSSNVTGVAVGIGNNNGGGSSGSGSGGGSSLGVNVGPATEYPNDLYMPSDYSKNFANHMDIPSNGSNMVMLSTTSLLHGNCVFNRNNTVATQQGMKTYWLCKSYRISMCRARCITHLGRIISATGVHNHMPHMRGGASNTGTPSSSSSVTVTPNPNPGQAGYNVSEGSHVTPAPAAAVVEINHGSGARLGANIFANQTSASPAGSHQHHHHHHHQHLTQALPNLLVQHHNSSHVSMEQHSMANGPPQPPPPPPPPSSSVIQNIMHNPNLMHLPMQAQPHPHHHQQQQQHSPHHLELGVGPGPSLLPLSPAQLQQQSPQSNRSSQSMHATESPLGMKSPPPPPQPADTEQRHMDINASADGSAESAAGTAAHVIDSITISPGSASHNFKIENI
ncbi:protein bric-a-brac 1 isoform X1 [Drosophila virilis]|uniref:Uncharacterized protein, isoform A n=1 Tax=Drosophila virilis TaxID=7244 RepID=B4MB93_DROVI|nr:broad-complex core protein isoform X1 [Drosophila virilis]EDW58364.1 uncharacterized protein Dvir_GJ14334, isoform A [Drosophila virilis]